MFTPARTPGGYRLYSPTDEARARRMLSLLGRGVAARESAELVLADATADEPSLDGLTGAWRAFDAQRAHAALDVLLAGPDAAAVVCRTVLPAFTDAATEWMRGETGLAQVHFAARLLETRLLALGQRWHEGSGPFALVGCGPGEQHTLGAIVCALALHERGWRIAYLGADAPLDGYAAAARALAAERIVLTFTMPWTLARAYRGLRSLAADFPLVLAGRAVSEHAALKAGATWFPGDPVDVAERL